MTAPLLYEDMFLSFFCLLLPVGFCSKLPRRAQRYFLHRFFEGEHGGQNAPCREGKIVPGALHSMFRENAPRQQFFSVAVKKTHTVRK